MMRALLLFLALVSATQLALAEMDREGIDPELRRVLQEAAESAESFPDRFEAEVWLTDMSRRLARQVPDAEERMLILRLVHRYARMFDLPPELVLAVIDVESNFDRYAISYAGALGLMQVMPFWRNEIGRPEDDLHDIQTNLLYGCRILAYYLEKENGDRRAALARYNGSRGQRWYPDRVFDRLGSKWYQY
ncbi:lytic transglycosylase domain-containing protein [Wenzhouxiangella sp. XN24]|uniref:lytic transglycosylase domain-containing protein n=1 Tax=Wenzhouxiangella sp. XN24 TaxID=2713569 RepID=UPI001F0FA448|nr:lytic transglycosylase domain-containing protein [Wenzhouxiangella sp. XN24]